MPELQQLSRIDAPSLAWSVHSPDSPTLGAVLVVHGYKDHSGRYLHAVERWVARGLVVGHLDLRGHGCSAGTRGDIRHFDDYLRDVSDVLVELERDARWHALTPPVLFGHSTGALVAMAFALREPARVRALALSSPYLGLAMKVPAWKLGLGRVLSGIAPSFGLDSGISVDMQTSCPTMQEAARTDPHRFSEARARWFTETLRVQDEVERRATEFALPVFCLAAGADRIADVERTRRVIAAIPGAELRILADHQHEILHEVQRAAHVDAYADWIERQFRG